MSQPYVGEIRMGGWSFAPAGWALCNGALMPISENETLFNLIGTTYGGDGQNTFALPDLQGRVPIHLGLGYVLAETGGSESVTLTSQSIPVHNHAILVNEDTDPGVTNTADTNIVVGHFPAKTVKNFYDSAGDVTLSNSSLAVRGGSQPHYNMQPFLCITFVISLFGVYPSPT